MRIDIGGDEIGACWSLLDASIGTGCRGDGEKVGIDGGGGEGDGGDVVWDIVDEGGAGDVSEGDGGRAAIWKAKSLAAPVR